MVSDHLSAGRAISWMMRCGYSPVGMAKSSHSRPLNILRRDGLLSIDLHSAALASPANSSDMKLTGKPGRDALSVKHAFLAPRLYHTTRDYFTAGCVMNQVEVEVDLSI